jgi:hypothetical protein
VFTTAPHRSLSWDRWGQLTPTKRIFLRSILILSRLCLGLPIDILLSGFATKLVLFLTSPIPDKYLQFIFFSWCEHMWPEPQGRYTSNTLLQISSRKSERSKIQTYCNSVCMMCLDTVTLCLNCTDVEWKAPRFPKEEQAIKTYVAPQQYVSKK